MNSKPLGNIALALSGGGYRAAAFHLGTLEALDELKLLSDVRVLSTASGGSIVGAAWVVSISKGESFQDFGERVRAILSRNVVAEALDRLHIGCGNPSLVRCAAEVYDEMFGGLRLGDIAKEDQFRRQLDRVVINATHFSLGYGFRFEFPPRPRSYFGNRAVKVDPDVWRDVRLADAVAASSCFPAGFEPILFPDEFAWPTRSPEVQAQGIGSENVETSLPLMDGGIYDNQAIDALLLLDAAAEATPEQGDDVELLFCSDTDQKEMPFYAPHSEGRAHAVVSGAPCGLVALLLAMACAALTWWSLGMTGWRATLAASAATLCGLPVVTFFVLVAVAFRSLPFRYGGLPRLLLRSSPGGLATLLARRLRSVLALTTSVFMYRVRSLGYSVAYLKMPHQIVASHIYDVDEHALDVSPRLAKCAARARRMKTTLWMTAQELDDVVTAGRAIAIGALHRYLERWRADEQAGRVFRPGLRFPVALCEEVEAAWERVNVG